jgi:ParB family transcriptional regulator, chromosome partitioning protein
MNESAPAPRNLKDIFKREGARANTLTHGEGRVLALDLIDPNPFQHRRRMDEGKLEELVDSIRANGLIEPVPVRRHPSDPGRYQLIAGHRRHAAFSRLRDAAATDADKLHWSSILSVEKQNISDLQMQVMGVVENGDRDDTSAVEQGASLLKLQADNGLTLDQILEITGWAKERVKRLLRIAQAPQVIQDACTTGIMVQLYNDEGQPLTTPKGRPAQEHRTLDLMGALELARLYEHLKRHGASDAKAADKVQKVADTALTDGWGFRRIQSFVKEQLATKRPKLTEEGTSSNTTGEGEGTRPAPSNPGPRLYREDDKQLVIYKARMADATADQKAALRAAVEAALAAPKPLPAD